MNIVSSEFLRRNMRSICDRVEHKEQTIYITRSLRLIAKITPPTAEEIELYNKKKNKCINNFSEQENNS